jgi:hypothetical protein
VATRRKLDRSDVRRAYRIVCPRPFAALVADAWAVVDEYDRLCRSGADKARQRALSLALDELMVEANGCDRCGIRVYPGPKQLMKALRVRARAAVPPATPLPAGEIAALVRLVTRAAINLS